MGQERCACTGKRPYHKFTEDVDNVGNDATRGAGEIFVEQGIQLESKPRCAGLPFRQKSLSIEMSPTPWVPA